MRKLRSSLSTSNIPTKRLATYFKNRPEVVAAYLFGSRARGAVSPLSDTDLAVLLKKNGIPYTYEADRLSELTSLLKTDAVDLVVLNHAPPLLQHQVLKDGCLIYCRDHRQRVKMEFRMLQEYLDLQPFYARQSKSFFHRIREGRFAKS